MKFGWLIFLFSLVICGNQSENIYLESSLISTNTINNSDFICSLNISKERVLSYGLQWWPSSNLYIFGALSPSYNKTNKLYQKISIGYSITELFYSDYTLFEIGSHRQRFNYTGNSSWFETTVHFRYFNNKIRYGFSITRLFNNYWNKLIGTIAISNTPVFSSILEGTISFDEQLIMYPSINLKINL